MRILIVEDDATVARALERSFRIKWGAVCEVVDTAEAAITCLGSGIYNAVTCDFNLAGVLKGDAVLAKMQSLNIADRFVFLTSDERVPKLHVATAIKPCPMSVLHVMIEAAAR